MRNNVKRAVAIVGMACEFPGAHSPRELWENVLAGRRFFRKAPRERLAAQYFDADSAASGKSYCDQMAVLEGWRFDPLAFRVPPVTFHASDMAHWLALYTAKAALCNAGLDLKKIDRGCAGVVLGNTLAGEFSRSHNLRHRWPYVERAVRTAMGQTGLGLLDLDKLLDSIRFNYESNLPEITEDTLAGNMSNTIAGRICGYFDLGGGGHTVDGGCSSALLAVAHSCTALVNGDLDFALAGGVDISLDPFEIVGFAKAQALARDDIRPYDQRASGMLPGEGCGLFVLVREADARAAGYPIHAVIRGWGISSDGAGGITAPEVDGQVRALSKAYECAGYPISTVSLIEGHGTGTTIGDKVEISAILRLLEAEKGSGVCRIGSIKANIGHCKAAAGAAGLTKAVMALKHKVFPPTVNCDQPNPVFGKPLARLRPSLRGQIWEAGPTPRRASISSMGFGGANSHVALEEANPDDPPAMADLALLGSAQSSELILLAASTTELLKQQIAKLIPIAERICRAEMTDLAAALVNNLLAGEIRLAMVAESPWQLADSLRLVLECLSKSEDVRAIDDASTGIFAGKSLANPSLVALFPGQGSQRPNMGEHLLQRFPFVRELYDNAGAGLAAKVFCDTLADDHATLRQHEAALKRTEVAQPAIVASSIAMLRVLEPFGLRPSYSIGHSLGEITALHAAGGCDAATAIRLASLRGRAMGSLQIADSGTMLAIAAGPEEVRQLIEPFSKSLVISNYNSPGQTVVSGATEAASRLRASCTSRNIHCQLLQVSHAFHSDIVAPAAVEFREAMKSVELGRLTGRVISTCTAAELSPDTDMKELLSQHIRRPVRFVEAVQCAEKLRPSLWLEVGPGGVLTNFVRAILGTQSVHCLPTDLSGEDGFHLLNNVLARAWVLGFPIATRQLFAHRFHRPFNVESYDPIFIVNPCERPLKAPETPVPAITASLSAALLPENASRDDFADYLARRGAFLRELIALDFRHDGGAASAIVPAPASAAAVKTAQSAQPPAPSTAREEAPKDKDALLAFAVEWIAKRTGFPTTAIGLDLRMRDDLNLDSIKVAELVVLMAQKLGCALKGDRAYDVNSTLHQLVDFLFQNIEQDAQQTGRSPGSSTRPEAAPATHKLPGLREWVRTFRMVSVPAPIEAEPVRPLPATRVGDELRALLPQHPHALIFVSHGEVEDDRELPELSRADREQIARETSEARRLTALASLVAARRAVAQFAREHRKRELSPCSIGLAHRADGRPVLRGDCLPDGLDITLADGASVSIALVGHRPVGVDLETVAIRDCETWRGLLGMDGYALALRVQGETGEPFDCAATRVWTLLEAGKKAHSLGRVLPQLARSLGGTWLSFKAEHAGQAREFISVLLSQAEEVIGMSAVVSDDCESPVATFPMIGDEDRQVGDGDQQLSPDGSR